MESFPRGGKKPGIKRSSDEPFEKHLKSKKRKIQKMKKKNGIIEETNLFATTADRLTKTILRDGMTVLGRVYEVSDFKMKVSLPGGLIGYVKAADICQSYTNMLEDLIKNSTQSNELKLLPHLFKCGDYVTCFIKMWSYVFAHGEEKSACHLSLDPAFINESISTNYLTKNTKIVGSVKSVEDHGYVIDTGIENVRAFIATEDVDKGQQYFVGTQLLFTIKEIKTADNTSIVKLSAKKKKINNASAHDITLDVLTPGTKLSLSITKLLSNGLEVTFGKNVGKNYIGYINQIYLNNPLSMYEGNMEVTGTLLYILPTVKLAYFSLLPDTLEKEKLHVGDIIEKAKVLYRESGLVLKLSQSGLRGYVSSQRTNVPFTKIPTEFKEGSRHKCRILAYDWMERIYICTMEEEILKEKYFSTYDINIGDILTVTVKFVQTTRGCTYVQVGKIQGTVPPEHISDSDASAIYHLKAGDKLEARVLNKSDDKNNVKFTLKQSLIKSKLPILYDFGKVKCGAKYHGTINMINKNGLLVRFFGMVKGWVPRTTLDNNTQNINWNFTVGQTVTVRVESVEENEHKMKLRIVDEEKEQVNFSLGELVKGTIAEASVKGIYLKIQKEENESNVVTGFLPAGHMSPCGEVGTLLASKYVPGDVISAFVFATKPTLILTRTFLKECGSFDSLKVGDCIPCSIHDMMDDGVRVILPIEDYSKLGFVLYKNISNFEHLRVNQILFVKITAINNREKQLALTMLLKEIWESPSEYEIKMMASIDMLSLYLSKLAELEKNPFYDNKPISSVVLGQSVFGIITKITEDGMVIRINNQLTGLVRKAHYVGIPKIGDKVFGTILWKNYVHDLVEVSLIPRIVNSISSKQEKLPELPTGTVLRAEILLITNWFILVLVKREGKGYLAALPARRHVNDNCPDLTPYKIHAKIRVYVIMKRTECDIVPICMLKSAFERPKNTITTESSSNKQLKKKKISESYDVDHVDSSKKESKKVLKSILKKPEEESKKENKKNVIVVEEEEEEEDEEEESRIKDIDENSELEEDSVEDEDETEEKESTEKLCVPECGFDWNDKAKLVAAHNAETSSDDEKEPEEDSKRKKKKKKKLSAAERREQERQKEREIRQREEALASNQAPNSSDQFDRLVLSSPDSSLVWLQYMAYHLQATEIDKARAVVRRAIKTINFREENERLNVYNAWLNLESKFGTADCLNDVFQEALKTNDAYKVYMHMLNVHADAGRKGELEKLIGTVIRKFKQETQTWIDCGTALLKIGMKEKSRQIMQRALQSLPESQHVNLLVRFANLENKLGDKERAQTLFENILSTYPKRVDVWSCYVDCLIKSENIDLARKVLERACIQTLPPRKMKTLFTKFINFEETYGTSEAVTRVRQMAADYVEKHV